MLLRINGSIIETGEKPYHVKEVFVGGRVHGSITISKSKGIHGYLDLHDLNPISLESDEILIIGKAERKDSWYKIGISEHRKNLVVYTRENKYQPYELDISIENLYVNIVLIFNPINVTIQFEPCNVEIVEKPYQLYIKLKAPE